MGQAAPAVMLLPKPYDMEMLEGTLNRAASFAAS
jgi:hypothetical protein